MYHSLKHTKPVLKTFKNEGLLFVYEGWLGYFDVKDIIFIQPINYWGLQATVSTWLGLV